jgi:ABC-type dipeptide/oligopeptide/nickel transport system permease subunit
VGATIRLLMRQRTVLAGMVLIGTLLAIAAIGPHLAADPLALDLDRGLSELGAPLGPSAAAPLGTDPLGRDVWARIVAGAGTSLGIATAATALALALGLAIGLVAGYAGGRIDHALMRLVDLALAFPLLLLAILLAAILREAGLAGSRMAVVIPLAIAGWTTFARVIRAKTRSVAGADFVLAAHALGASDARVMLRHVLPNLTGVLAAITVLVFAQTLINEAVLSYLGLGVPPPAPTWGRMVHEGLPYYRSAPWLLVAPAVAIVVTVAGFHLLGAGLRAVFDPRGRR